jgi:hypothetical protein
VHRSSNHHGNTIKIKVDNKQKNEYLQKIIPVHKRVEFEKGGPSKRPLTTRNVVKDDYMSNIKYQRFSNRNAPPRRPPTTRYQNLFLGYFFSCHDF